MLSASHIAKIRAEVERAATAHLHAKDAKTALSHCTDDVVAVSNTDLFPSRESLAVDIGEYYRSLKHVTYASWEDVRIHVIDEGAAIFTARFRYGFTAKDGRTTDLWGVWTALFVLERGIWKIRVRHESFEQTP